MLCRELLNNGHRPGQVDRSRYEWLYPEAKKLIVRWYDRAEEMRDASDEECFEPFIFLWFSFNAWAACVTGIDRDRDWIDALAQDEALSEDFNRALTGQNAGLADAASGFNSLWPIYKAQEIRRGMVRVEGERTDVIQQYRDSGIRHYSPACAWRHRDASESIPLDWPHTLHALYRVRCNLFHGEKDPASENDRVVVASSFRTLLAFLEANQCIRGRHAA